MIGKKSGEQFYHSGGILITQVKLNSGTVELQAKIGDMEFDKLKTFSVDDEPFTQIRAPKGGLKFVITGDAVADCSQ